MDLIININQYSFQTIFIIFKNVSNWRLCSKNDCDDVKEKNIESNMSAYGTTDIGTNLKNENGNEKSFSIDTAIEKPRLKIFFHLLMNTM